MKKLIDADALIESLSDLACRNMALYSIVWRKIEDAPAVDALPCAHWIFEHHERDTGYLFIRIVCSNCGLKTGEKSNYCPQCGAKMDKEEVIKMEVKK